ncbi:MAG: homocysteine S-methyltransferase family protein [Syntrophales bacterium]|nr:homocysteine S-methyltransferase family protein [Syntrophales bacterium]MDY0043211.1 homocysteine S-methyltransferase family protein [Syntrophales bacterium]
MAQKINIGSLLKKRIVILDGASGTELQKRGMPAGECPEKWCMDNPEALLAIHREYQSAGADILYSATFGANRIKLSQYGITNVREINTKLVKIARKAVGTHAIIAGDIGPTGRFVEPFGDLAFEDAVDIFKEQIEGLLKGGADILVIETMIDIQEARAALIAARELSNCFVMVTMTYEHNGRTLNGTDPVSALITLQSLGAHAVGCNCSTGPAEMKRLIEAMKPYSKVPLAAKPNAGMPELKGTETVFNMTAIEFADFGREFAEIGVGLMGGCCGTTPEHIRELSRALSGKKSALPGIKAISALSSARRTVFLENGNPLKIVGEQINPTGKKDLQEELRLGKTTLIDIMAKNQQKSGADLLDVNVGAPGVDQKLMMREAVKRLSVAADAPLVLDSSDPEAIEAGLRIYPGRALINSISGEKKKIEELLPLAARYGAMFILLPLTEEGVPEKAEERCSIIRLVYRKAFGKGFRKPDIVVDGLVMAVSADPASCSETLKTVEWAHLTFGCASIIGLSNISFGMPERIWLNAAFLAMAVYRGLTLAIANPELKEIMNIKAAGDLLSERDKDGSSYLAHFAEGTARHNDVKEKLHLTPEERIFSTIVEGSRDEIETALTAALDAKLDPSYLIKGCMIEAITEVGRRYEKREYFLPQLIAAAETMRKGVFYLEPLIKKAKQNLPPKTTIIIATVAGDIHDIGKNIVSLMLKNQGFEILDLGKDVAAERIIEEIKRTKAPIAGLSALMTTTMIEMEKVISLARSEDVACDFMLGGAAVTRTYALSIGGFYAKDGVEAVQLANRLISKKRDAFSDQ